MPLPKNKYYISVHAKNIKVPLTPKYFFGLNKSLHLFETHCGFLNKSWLIFAL